MSGDPLLEVRGLCHRYRGGGGEADEIEALRGLDLDVRKGIRLAILGPNGAGKSTLFLHLNGTLRPAHGTIRIGGQLVDYDRAGRRAWRQQVGLVFQNPDDQLFAPTVHEDVSFGPLNLGLKAAEVEARVEAALALLDLRGLSRRAPWTLSQGQKRRVAIAGVVAMRPQLLILDEPLAGLDLVGAGQLERLLEDVRQTGVTIIMATHDLDFAAAWADEIAIIDAGRTICQGPTLEIFADVATMRRAALPTPLVVELATRLRQIGVIDRAAPFPRTRTVLLEQLNWLNPDAFKSEGSG